MKIIKLLALKLYNFKGIESFEFNPNGHNTNVYADNGLGKTTLADAHSWLWSGKDSLGNSTNNMKIKTKDENDQIIHRLDHTVEGLFLVDGVEVTLKKVYKEVWRKKTGDLTEKHTGHTTDFFIDGAPTKEKDYNEYIGNIVDLKALPLLIDLWHFNETYNNDKRRGKLFEIIGDITDEEIINSTEELKELPSIIETRTVEKHMEKILFEQKSINDRLDEIPSLVKENVRNLPEVKEADANVSVNIDKLSFQIEEKNDQIGSIRNGSEISGLKKQISDIDLKIANVRNDHTQNEQEELYKLKARLQEEQSNRDIMRIRLKSQVASKEQNEGRIKDNEELMQKLRDEYAEVNAKKFDHESECVCPTCDQDLPEEQTQEVINKFNLNKSNQLESINGRGKELKKQNESLEKTVETEQKEIDKVTEQGKVKASEIEKLEQKIKDAESNVKPIEENEEYIKLINEKKVLEDQIDKLEKSVDESIQSVLTEIETLKAERSVLQDQLSAFDQANKQVKKIKNRNKELEEEQQEKSKQHNELERQKHLLNKFTKTKVSMIEGNINKHFKHVNFKLFEELQNGGLRDVCIVTYDGKEYGPELNEAKRYNASLDVINTLSEHHGVRLPILIDKAESATKMIDTENQIIRLVVSELSDELFVGTKEEFVAHTKEKEGVVA